MRCNTIFLQKIFLILVIISSTIRSQNKKSLDVAFTSYTKPYKEIVYAHLNKTKLIKGEEIGFTVYTFHKQSRLLSKNTTNLYCYITDNFNKIIAKKLIKATNGIAYNSFKIDKKFEEGKYTISIFTNWMLNFSEKPLFTESFKVIDASIDKAINSIKRGSNLDIQALPESGHFLNNVLNTVGVIVKDSLNYGLPYLDIELQDEKNNTLRKFKLNKLGIGRFTFIPEIHKKYKLVLNYQGKQKIKHLQKNIKNNGIILRLTYNKEHCIVSIVTNKKTLPTLLYKKFLLTYNDGSSLTKTNVFFNDETTIIKKIPLDKLSPGINTFTLFNQKEEPILERLFFNYKRINIEKSTIVKKIKTDSTFQLTLNYKKLKKETINNISVSILPQKTNSYKKNTNIIAQVLLKPFIRGTIENAGYYFKEVNIQKKYDLDNLLITQGWSSYDWNKIFNEETNSNLDFESGISFKVIIPEKVKERKFIIHKSNQRNAELVSLNKSNTTFSLSSFFPEENDPLYISKINNKGKLNKAEVNIKFFPNTFPKINRNINLLKVKEDFYATENSYDTNLFEKLNKIQVLDTVVIKTSLEQKRREKLIKKSYGRIYFVEKSDNNLTLASYLNSKPGLRAYDDMKGARLDVRNTRTDSVPTLLLDGLRVGRDQLFFYFMDQVDYIEIDNFVTGDTFGSGLGGSISIYTDPYKSERSKPTLKKYNYPLTFSKPKEFYIPKYQNYNNTFYKNFGVIDWLPINKINKNGDVILYLKEQPKVNYKLFIEGFTDNGSFIFEEKILELK